MANVRFILLSLPTLWAVNCAEPEPSKNTDSTDTTSTEPSTNSTDADSEHTPSTGTEDRELPSGEPDANIAVGDEVAGQVVIDVYDWGDCTEIELQAEPLFTCSSSQLSALNTSNAAEPAQVSAGAPELARSDCASLAALRRPALERQLHARLESRYTNLLAEYCEPQTHYVYIENGEWTDSCSGFGWSADAGAYVDDDGQYDPSPEPTEEASDYSTTNTQVADVDEADWVKNDAGTIYVLNESQLLVFDAWPIEELTEVARIDLPAEPRRMFLEGDRLAVYLRVGAGAEVCTYGYECRSASEGGATLLQVYDVSDPEFPLLQMEYRFSGAYLASRRIGPSVYSVLHDEGVSAPAEADTSLDAEDPDALQEQFERKSAAVDTLIDELPDDYFLPWAEGRAPGGDYVPFTECDEALASEASAGNSFVSVIGLDLEELGTPQRTLLGSKPGFVYSSATAMYLAVDGVDGDDNTFSSQWLYDGAATTERSTIHKFGLDDGRVTYEGTSTIPGHVLNQFSMDEHDGVLRVATSNGWVPDPEVSSNIVTLGDIDGKFEVIGELTGLAPTEDIRSVRFDGERGFVVTFKKTDPLFVIGLEDATAPVVLGELKIPGFSTYMHLMDAQHLLAVGFDADDQGSFAYFEGIQIQIFDVTDLEAPVLQHKAVIGTRGSGSEALMDHLAFNYFPSRGVLALPATICQGGGEGTFGDQFEFSGLMVFDVSLEGGITERGRLPFVTPGGSEDGETPDCYSWWTDSSSLVKRSIFMEDYAIGLSKDWLRAAQLDELGNVLQSLPLAD